MFAQLQTAKAIVAHAWNTNAVVTNAYATSQMIVVATTNAKQTKHTLIVQTIAESAASQQHSSNHQAQPHT